MEPITAIFISEMISHPESIYGKYFGYEPVALAGKTLIYVTKTEKHTIYTEYIEKTFVFYRINTKKIKYGG